MFLVGVRDIGLLCAYRGIYRECVSHRPFSMRVKIDWCTWLLKCWVWWNPNCTVAMKQELLNSTFKWKYLLPDVKKSDFICFFGGLHGCQGKVNAEAFIRHSTTMRLLTRPLSQICFPIQSFNSISWKNCVLSWLAMLNHKQSFEKRTFPTE